jgi:hypothetical protein
MIKSCREIAEEIEELRKDLQKNKLIQLSSVDFSERKKCESLNATSVCSNCNCWKSAREYCS